MNITPVDLLNFFISPANATTIVTNNSQAITTLNALLSSLTGLLALVTALTYLIGVAMIIRGVMQFKTFGQHITMASNRGEVAGPLVSIVIGALFLYLPGTLGFSFRTVFGLGGTSSLSITSAEINALIGYAPNSSETTRLTMQVLLGYTKLIGLIAFARGLSILSHITSPQSAQQGTLTKGIVHIVGGVAAMNILHFINVLSNTMGYGNMFNI